MPDQNKVSPEGSRLGSKYVLTTGRSYAPYGADQADYTKKARGLPFKTGLTITLIIVVLIGIVVGLTDILVHM